MAVRSRHSSGTRCTQAKAQLSLVEHALCPLDSDRSLKPNFVHETSYFFSDKHRNRRKARVRIGAIDGLSAHDEFYLWGLLAFALSQPEPKPEFLATPYYCLRQFGVLEADNRGGRAYVLFRSALRRLAGVRYHNTHFYDPIRGEHREVSFGLLNYSLPLSSDSSRAWRFAWDPIFFELCRATGGALSFDLPLYRDFDAGARRLYLFLKKLFWRHDETPPLELRHLAVEVMGFSPTIDTRNLKRKVARCVQTLVQFHLVEFPLGSEASGQLFQKAAKGTYKLRLRRGEQMNATAQRGSKSVEDSPLFEPLKSIGFDAATIHRLMQKYPAAILEQWADITLAANERNGSRFFTTSPQAYFVDNINAALKQSRTPPDWWRELRKQERIQQEEQQRSQSQLLPARSATISMSFDEYLKTEAREAFEQVMDKLRHDLESSGQSCTEARRTAEQHSRIHFWNKFRQEHGLATSDHPFSLREFLGQVG